MKSSQNQNKISSPIKQNISSLYNSNYHYIQDFKQIDKNDYDMILKLLKRGYLPHLW